MDILDIEDCFELAKNLLAVDQTGYGRLNAATIISG